MLLVVSLLQLVACGDDASDGAEEAGDLSSEWPAFLSLAELVEASDSIVVATLVAERIEEIEIPAEDDAEGRDVVTEVIRTFAAEDVLAGFLEPGDVFVTFSTANVAHYPAGGGSPQEAVFQVLRLDDGESYLLFLSMVILPEYYPEEWGVVAWAAPGEPHAARVEADGALRWLTTGRYDAAREARDISPGQGGAGPEFDTTLEAVRELARTAQGAAAPRDRD